MESDIKKLMDVLSNQNTKGVESNDWSKLNPVLRVVEQDNPSAGHHKGDTHVTLESVSIKFIFGPDGRLNGISNWKW